MTMVLLIVAVSWVIFSVIDIEEARAREARMRLWQSDRIAAAPEASPVIDWTNTFRDIKRSAHHHRQRADEECAARQHALARQVKQAS